MNGLPDVAVCVELVERVVKVAVDVRDPAGLPVQVVDVLEQVLLVLCELLDELIHLSKGAVLARLVQAGELGGALQDLDRAEDLAVVPLVVLRDLGVHAALLLLGHVGHLRVLALLLDLDPFHAPLPDAHEVLRLVGQLVCVGELATHLLVVLHDRFVVEDAEHVLHDVRGIDFAVLRGRGRRAPVEELAHVVLEPLDNVLAERVLAAADLDDLLAFDALQTFTADELLLRVDLEHHDLRLEGEALERAVHVHHRVLLRLAGVHLDVVPRDDVAEVLVDAVFGIFELFDGASPVRVARLGLVVVLREPDDVNRRQKRAQETTGILLVLRRVHALVRVDVREVDFVGRCDARDEDDGPRFCLVGTQLVLGGRVVLAVAQLLGSKVHLRVVDFSSPRLAVRVLERVVAELFAKEDAGGREFVPDFGSVLLVRAVLVAGLRLVVLAELHLGSPTAIFFLTSPSGAGTSGAGSHICESLRRGVARSVLALLGGFVRHALFRGQLVEALLGRRRGALAPRRLALRLRSALVFGLLLLLRRVLLRCDNALNGGGTVSATVATSGGHVLLGGQRCEVGVRGHRSDPRSFSLVRQLLLLRSFGFGCFAAAPSAAVAPAAAAAGGDAVTSAAAASAVALATASASSSAKSVAISAVASSASAAAMLCAVQEILQV